MQCPHCQLTMQDAAHLAGQMVACPRCSGEFVVPAGFDPYYTWLGIPPSEQPANHYRLLGVQLFESNPSVIENAADRQMKHLQSFKIGAKAALSQRLLTEISAARVQLLDPARKAAYDQPLRAGMGRASPANVFPQLTAGPSFTPPVAGGSGVRRIARRGNSMSLFSSVWMIVGGVLGLAMGVMIVFYLTGQDFLGLSGKLKPTPIATPGPLTPSSPNSGSGETTVQPKMPRKSVPTTIPVSPSPPSVAPPVEQNQPKPPEVVELFAEVPKFLRLPMLGASTPEPWFSLIRELNEPLTFTLHAEAATLPASTTFRVQAEPGESSWIVEHASEAAGGERTTVGSIRREGRQLSFAWSASAVDADMRRQLANCLLQMTVGNEFRTVQLREPMASAALVIDFAAENQQRIELNVADAPASAKLFVKAEVVGFSRGGKIRGDSAIIPFSRPLVIEFSDFKGPEIELRFVRLTTGKLTINVKPQFIEAANRKFDLTFPQLEKTTRALEKTRAESQDTLTFARRTLTEAQNDRQNLQNNPPANNAQSQAYWNNQMQRAIKLIGTANKAIADATQDLNEAQNRLTAGSEIRGFMDQLRVARIKYTIFAKAGGQELVVVEGTGQ